MSSPSPPKFPPNGDDYIGNESCINVQNKNKGVGHSEISLENKVTCNRINKKKQKRVFPPPIPLLARTQNLASHMPWVLKRYYTSEGRLILKEERVRHHEYFQAHRENGRLTLQLILLGDDYDYDYDYEFSEVEETPETEIPYSTSEEVIDNITLDGKSALVVEENVANEEIDDIGVVGGANGRVSCCLNCNSVRSASSSIFTVPVHPVRTVVQG